MSGLGLIMMALGGPPGQINSSLPNGVASGSAAWQLLNDGTYAISASQTGNWVTPANATVAAFYEVKVDETIGTFASGTVGTFVAMSSNRTWTVEGASVQFTVTFRELTTGRIRSVQAGVTLDGT